MGRIFLTSDLHMGHDREFVWKVRGYDSVQAMNLAQVQKWNETVKDEDDIYALGDLMLGDPDNIEFIKQLKGRIHIVLGNHDTANREKMYRELPNVVEVAEVGIRLKYKKHHFVLTHYPMLTGNLEKESLKQMTLNLYGHTHQLTNFYNDMPFMYHVGVDSHDGIPVLLDDIIEEMYAKVKECKDFLDEEPVYFE
jgi:calcineurin-like phosphoesterase family protein